MQTRFTISLKPGRSGVGVDHFISAIQHNKRALNALHRELGGKGELRWTVDRLRNPDPQTVEIVANSDYPVAEEYNHGIAHIMETGAIPRTFTIDVITPLFEVLKVPFEDVAEVRIAYDSSEGISLNGRLLEALRERLAEEQTVDPVQQDFDDAFKQTKSIGSIRGRYRGGLNLSRRRTHRLFCIVTTDLGDKVECMLPDDFSEIPRDWVVTPEVEDGPRIEIEGYIHRNQRGRPEWIEATSVRVIDPTQAPTREELERIDMTSGRESLEHLRRVRRGG